MPGASPGAGSYKHGIGRARLLSLAGLLSGGLPTWGKESSMDALLEHLARHSIDLCQSAHKKGPAETGPVIGELRPFTLPTMQRAPAGLGVVRLAASRTKAAVACF